MEVRKHIMMDIFILLKIFLLSLCPWSHAILPDYWPKNCTKMEMYKETQTIELEYDCFTTEDVCKGWFFRKVCGTYLKKKTCKYSQDIEVVRYRTVYTCCTGYMDTGNASYCDKGCDIGFWGMSCDQPCGCPANAFAECNMYTGECTCQAGWMGENCDQHCNTGYFGQGCDMICLCENNSTCNSVLGTCDCSTSPGWKGNYCNEVCESGRFGVNCVEECLCGPNTTCNAVNGTCTCITGVTGENCDTSCTNFTYGVDCRERCTCNEANTESCDPVSGECSCKSGYYEDDCDTVCEDGYYGSRCTGVCNCSVHEMCNPFTGECVSKCLCNKDGTSNCQNESCPCPENKMDVFMNTNSTEEEESYLGVTECCFPNSTQCDCKEGWQGVFCQSACSPGTYGYQCSSSCNCKDPLSCNHITGECPQQPLTSGSVTNGQAQIQQSSSAEPPVLTVVLSVLLSLLLIAAVTVLVFCILTGRIKRCCKKDFGRAIKDKFRETSRKIRGRFGGTYHEATFPTNQSETAPYHVLERDYKKDQVMVGGSLYSHAVDNRAGHGVSSGRSMYDHAIDNRTGHGVSSGRSMYDHAVDNRTGHGVSSGRSMYDHAIDRKVGNKATVGGSSLYSHAVDRGYNTAGTGSAGSQIEDSYGYSQSTEL